MELRNPYPLRRQKAFLVPGVVPKKYLEKLKDIPTWGYGAFLVHVAASI